MNGALLAGAGVWVLCQVFGGQALVRLGILPAPDSGDRLDNPHDNIPPQDFGKDGRLKL